MNSIALNAAAATLRAARPPLAFVHGAAAPRLPRVSSPFIRDVLAGLSRPQKAIPSTWLYDARGCELFEQITQLDEYYPTRTETAILERCAGEIAAAAGPGATLVELGSGSSVKTRLLLAALDSPSVYVPIDISETSLAAAAQSLRQDFPRLDVRPIVGDFCDPATLAPLRRGPGALQRAARAARPWGRRVGFFPGSTIGNFDPGAAVGLLASIGQALGDDALLVIGVDSTLDPAVLLPAYDDAQGVTAEFNRNLLVRINRELEGDFEPRAFRHEARFNAEHQRVEMHLVSRTWETFEVLGRRFGFPAGDSIRTEISCKYTRARLQHLAARAGWSALQYWTDAGARFAVHVFERAAADR